MPHSIVITGQKYGGGYTYYTRQEADEHEEISYHIPPFAPLEVPSRGWVLTSNNFVVPILARVKRSASSFDYVTPFGKHKYSEMPFMDGRTHTRGVTMNHYADSNLDMRNVAYWQARHGDAAIAWRMAKGYEAPPDIDDYIRDPQYQIILHGEYEKVADELGMPKGFIIEHRQRQTSALTELVEASKDVILRKLRDSEELNATEMQIFLELFNAQQGNMTDLEQGYMRTPKDDGQSTAMLEEHYSRKAIAGPQGFHMEKVVKQEGADVDPDAPLVHPDGFHDIDYSNSEPSKEEVNDG